MIPMGPDLQGQSVLAVFAHPDDESIACGGTLAVLAEAGARVVVMCASHGERGSAAGPVRDDDLGRQRALELCAAAQALSVAEVRLLSHPDGNLRWAEVTELHAEIVLFLRRHPTAAVITFGQDGLYWHPDHIGVHERVVSAVLALGADAPPLYFVSMANGVMTQIVGKAIARGWTAPTNGFWSIVPESFGLLADPHTIEVNVQPVLARKLQAILAHHSQMGTSHPFSDLDAADSARWLGTECFRRAPVPGRADMVLEQLCVPSF
jgi:LmbE family N-acetylglucosaminyl deacetylase